MAFIREWITNITVVIIFTMLMDLLIPNNNMKRFAKVIMGLLIILVIIKPFLMVKSLGYEFEATMSQAAAYIEDSSGEDGTAAEAFQNKRALSLYKEKLSEKVTEIVKNRSELQNRNIKVNIDIENDINNKEFGSIKSIHVIVERDGAGSVQASVIEPVKINAKTVINKKQDSYNLNNSKLSQDLSADITTALGLKKTAVSIEIQE